MKINDILKEENAGKIFIIKNKGWEGTKATVTDYFSVEIDAYGRATEITDIINLRDILDLEFEEEKPYKEISGREALKLMLEGEVVYDEPELETKYYITNDILKYRRPYEMSDSGLTLSDVLRGDWYIEN